MTQKQDRLERLRKRYGIPNIEYGMYVEVYSTGSFGEHVYHGYLKKIRGDYIILINGKSDKINCHPTWQTVYYDSPVSKNIVYDFREEAEKALEVMKNEATRD